MTRFTLSAGAAWPQRPRRERLATHLGAVRDPGIVTLLACVRARPLVPIVGRVSQGVCTACVPFARPPAGLCCDAPSWTGRKICRLMVWVVFSCRFLFSFHFTNHPAAPLGHPPHHFLRKGRWVRCKKCWFSRTDPFEIAFAGQGGALGCSSTV
jgi:hypothetical protein